MSLPVVPAPSGDEPKQSPWKQPLSPGDVFSPSL